MSTFSLDISFGTHLHLSAYIRNFKLFTDITRDGYEACALFQINDARRTPELLALLLLRSITEREFRFIT